MCKMKTCTSTLLIIAADAFEFVSYLTAYQVDNKLAQPIIRGEVHGVKMVVTFHAIYYHINSGNSVDYRTEVYDRLAQNEKGKHGDGGCLICFQILLQHLCGAV